MVSLPAVHTRGLVVCSLAEGEYSRVNIFGCGRLAKATGKAPLVARTVREIHVGNRLLESGEEALAILATSVASAPVKERPHMTG